MPQFGPMTDAIGYHDLLGVEVVEWREGYARLAVRLVPQLLNRAGILHGGVLLAMLDEAGAMSGVWCSVPENVRSSVTVDLTGSFTGQSKTGMVFATGELVSHGRSLYFTRSEVRDEAGRVLAYGTSTHKWRRGSETVEGATRVTGTPPGFGKPKDG